MSQANTEIRFQLLLSKANSGDQKAISELTHFAFQTLECNDDSQKAQFGVTLLKKLSNYGDKSSQKVLAEKIDEFALKISGNNPKLAFHLFVLAGKAGNLDAKRNLAVCFFNGQGTERQPDKVMGLLKECYEAGNQSVLEDMNTMADKFLSGDNRIPRDLRRAVELLMFTATAGHILALKNLGFLGVWFYRGFPYDCPQDIPQGIKILKMAAKLGDKTALDNLVGVGVDMIKTEPKEGFELFALANELGALQAKYNLAICFLEGTGTERDINKAIQLFKACDIAGKPNALDGINSVAASFSSRLHECQKDLELSIELLVYAAKRGHQKSQEDLFKIANCFLTWERFEHNYGVQQGILTGLRILHYLAKTLKNLEAEEQLTQIQALKISVPIWQSFQPRPSFEPSELAFLTPNSRIPEEPRSPRTDEFLKKYNFSMPAPGVLIGGGYSSGVLDSLNKNFPGVLMKSTLVHYFPTISIGGEYSSRDIDQFKAERDARKLEHFTKVVDALNEHFPPVSPVQETICGYIPDEVSPLFFQYRHALAALDKNPQLECLSIEETPSEATAVKVHV